MAGMKRNWPGIGARNGTGTAGSLEQTRMTKRDRNRDRKLLGGHSAPPKANSGTFGQFRLERNGIDNYVWA